MVVLVRPASSKMGHGFQKGWNMSESKMSENDPAPPSIQTIEEIPVLHPTAIQEGHSSNAFVLVLADDLPIFNKSDPNRLTGQNVVLPIGVIKMSPQTAKDLFLLMRTGIEQYEREYGPIHTAYSRSLDEERE